MVLVMSELSVAIDEIDRDLLDHLQSDGRMPVSHLSRALKRSATAVAERLSRLVREEVITGFYVQVDPKAVGYPTLAFVRARTYQGADAAFLRVITELDEVIECHHTTGEDCYQMRVVARDMSHLEHITSKISQFGQTTTAVVFSTPISRRPVPVRGAERAEPR